MRHLRCIMICVILLIGPLLTSACTSAAPQPAPLAQAASLAPTETPAPLVSTDMPVPVYPAPGNPNRSTPDAYPAPVSSLDPTLAAYPGPEVELTYAAERMTLTAWPARTPTPAPPTLTPTPTRGPLAKPLPAPVYMIVSVPQVNPPPRQIWRLERDGYTFAQVTHEEKGVDDFYDVAADGRLAYVSDNSLVISGPRGENRRVVVKGKPLPPMEEMDDAFVDFDEIESPAWSPDGRKIAYRHNGVNLLDLSSGKTIQVMAESKKTGSETLTHLPPHLKPFDWTPDGGLIMLYLVYYESARTAFIAPVANATPVTLNIEYAGCCEHSFTSSGKMLFSSGDHLDIGLWLVDPQTGYGQLLNEPKIVPGGFGPMVRNPFQAPDGRIFFFTTKTGGPAEEPYLMLAVVDGKKSPFRIPEDLTFVNLAPLTEEALWMPDASRVIISGNGNQIAVMDTTTGQIIPLGIDGGGLKWGAK